MDGASGMAASRCYKKSLEISLSLSLGSVFIFVFILSQDHLE